MISVLSLAVTTCRVARVAFSFLTFWASSALTTIPWCWALARCAATSAMVESSDLFSLTYVSFSWVRFPMTWSS